MKPFFGRVLASRCSAALLLTLVACSEEVDRVLSPDGRTEAILIANNAGATTGFGYGVYLRPTRFWRGRRVEAARLYGATRGECAYGVRLRWQGSNRLRVQYLRADGINQERPFVTVGGQQIDVLLEDGIEDRLGAPCGGMHRNGER